MTQRENLIILRPSAEGRMLKLLLPGFFLVVLLAVAAVLVRPALFLLILCLLTLLVLYYILSGKHEIRFDEQEATEQTAFACYHYSYEGTEVLLRRSWTTTMGRCPGGLNRTAISLCRKGKVLLTVPVGWGPPEELRRAMQLLERLPISKHYL